MRTSRLALSILASAWVFLLLLVFFVVGVLFFMDTSAYWGFAWWIFVLVGGVPFMVYANVRRS